MAPIRWFYFLEKLLNLDLFKATYLETTMPVIIGITYMKDLQPIANHKHMKPHERIKRIKL